jgi:Flp pilus assembly protein CpaB
VRPLRRLHIFVARRPPLSWTLTLLLAAVPAVIVALQIMEARDARDSWLERHTILVASRPLAPGEAVRADAVERREWPVALLPDGALEVLPDPAVASAPVAAGEPLVAARLGRPDVGAVASLVPSGTRAVAVARGDAPLPVEVGDRVDVVAALDPATAAVVAAGAVVVHVDDATAVVAVAATDVAAAAAAVVAGGAVLALSGER